MKRGRVNIKLTSHGRPTLQSVTLLLVPASTATIPLRHLSKTIKYTPRLLSNLLSIVPFFAQLIVTGGI